MKTKSNNNEMKNKIQFTSAQERKMISAGVKLLRRNAHRIGLHLAMEGLHSALALMTHIINNHFPNVSLESRKKMMHTFVNEIAID